MLLSRLNKILITAEGIEELAGALVDPSKEGVLVCQQLPAFVGVPFT